MLRPSGTSPTSNGEEFPPMSNSLISQIQSTEPLQDPTQLLRSLPSCQQHIDLHQQQQQWRSAYSTARRAALSLRMRTRRRRRRTVARWPRRFSFARWPPQYLIDVFVSAVRESKVGDFSAVQRAAVRPDAEFPRRQRRAPPGDQRMTFARWRCTTIDADSNR